MTGYISGAALTVIMVPSFHQKGVCVCVCVVATSPGTTSACNAHAGNCAFRQQALHTPLYIHTCLISSKANLFHWHAFEYGFKPQHQLPIWYTGKRLLGQFFFVFFYIVDAKMEP